MQYLSELANAGAASSDLVQKYDAASTMPSIDYMARVWMDGDLNYDLNVTLIETDTFIDNMNRILEENLILKNAVKNLWETVRYNNEYTSFLLEQYTKEEFIDIAKTFATQPVSNIQSEKIVQAVNVIFSIFDDKLTSYDLATMLNIDCSLIEESLSSQLEKQKRAE